MSIERVFLFLNKRPATTYLRAISSKIKTCVLSTFLAQKMFDIELYTQFCLKNVDKTRVFISVQMAHKILRAVRSKMKTLVPPTFLEQNCVFS